MDQSDIDAAILEDVARVVRELLQQQAEAEAQGGVAADADQASQEHISGKDDTIAPAVALQQGQQAPFAAHGHQTQLCTNDGQHNHQAQTVAAQAQQQQQQHVNSNNSNNNNNNNSTNINITNNTNTKKSSSFSSSSPPSSSSLSSYSAQQKPPRPSSGFSRPSSSASSVVSDEDHHHLQQQQRANSWNSSTQTRPGSSSPSSSYSNKSRPKSLHGGPDLLLAKKVGTVTGTTNISAYNHHPTTSKTNNSIASSTNGISNNGNINNTPSTANNSGRASMHRKSIDSFKTLNNKINNNNGNAAENSTKGSQKREPRPLSRTDQQLQQHKHLSTLSSPLSAGNSNGNINGMAAKSTKQQQSSGTNSPPLSKTTTATTTTKQQHQHPSTPPRAPSGTLPINKSKQQSSRYGSSSSSSTNNSSNSMATFDHDMLSPPSSFSTANLISSGNGNSNDGSLFFLSTSPMRSAVATAKKDASTDGHQYYAHPEKNGSYASVAAVAAPALPVAPALAPSTLPANLYQQQQQQPLEQQQQPQLIPQLVSASQQQPASNYFSAGNLGPSELNPGIATATAPFATTLSSSSTTSTTATSTVMVTKPATPLVNRPRRKKALLIGINYFGDPNQLLGCINDSREVFGFLNGFYGFRYQDTIILTDDQIYEEKRPTGANIRYWMKWLVKDAQPQDSLFFHYAGHGGRVKDFSYNGSAEHLGDEADGYDEVIYPSDYLRGGVISDDEIYDLMVKELPENVQLTALIDSCHSGTMLDLPFVYNGSSVTVLEVPDKPIVRHKVGAMADTSISANAPAMSEILVSLPNSNPNAALGGTASESNNDVKEQEPKRSIVMEIDTDTNTEKQIQELQILSSTVTPTVVVSKHSTLSRPGTPPSSTATAVTPSLAINTNVANLSPAGTLLVSPSPTSATSSTSLSSTLSSPSRRSKNAKKDTVSIESNHDTNSATNNENENDHDNDDDEDDDDDDDDDKEFKDKTGEQNLDQDQDMANTSASATSATRATTIQAPEKRENELALFRQTKGRVVMFSGCRDDQASADIRASQQDAKAIQSILERSAKAQNSDGGLSEDLLPSNAYPPLSPSSMSSPSQSFTQAGGQQNVNNKTSAASPAKTDTALPVPFSSPIARGAVTYAWIKCLSQRPEQSYEELLKNMRVFMKHRDLEQVPQLGSGHPMEMSEVFSL